VVAQGRDFGSRGTASPFVVQITAIDTRLITSEVAQDQRVRLNESQGVDLVANLQRELLEGAGICHSVVCWKSCLCIYCACKRSAPAMTLSDSFLRRLTAILRNSARDMADQWAWWLGNSSGVSSGVYQRHAKAGAAVRPGRSEFSDVTMSLAGHAATRLSFTCQQLLWLCMQHMHMISSSLVTRERSQVSPRLARAGRGQV
jgi:hypothetical protein